MENENILENLNLEQKKAVQATDGPILILAGPGSGKTKVLTHRLSYLIKQGIPGQDILAVTFTNKAADEMKKRTIKLLAPLDAARLTGFIGTFHSFCLKILRNEIDKLGYKKNFVIYDENDQLNLIKEVIKNIEINQEQFPAKRALHVISSLKNETIDYETYGENAQEYFEKTIAKIYQKYQSELKKNNALDFDDLIMLTVKLFENFPEILEFYQEKYKYIMVDEYQDTDPSQYKLIKLLSLKYRNVCVVGDDAQSIYSFRNADFRNILNFEKDYPQAKVITLDQNYRSTQNILDAASKLISKNVYQKPKNLWTKNPSGPPISIIGTWDEKSEAGFIVQKIKEFLKQGYKLHDFAVFYRTNAQSRAIEEAFIKNNVPYKLIGAIRFYQRKEIKDIVSYLKYITVDDSMSLKRIINTPTRGIGKITLDRIIKNGIEKVAEEKPEVGIFHKFIKKAKEFAFKNPLTKLLKFILKETDYQNYLKKTYGDNELQAGLSEDEARWQNIEELINVGAEYDKLPAPDGLKEFLGKTALLSDADEIQNNKEVVHLMTLHTAKGLEFPIIFIIGCEEGILPHSRSLLNPLDIEEERRLFYVGITRSKTHLHLVVSQRRTSWGSKEANMPSRFLSEIPEHLINYEEYEPEIKDLIDF
ncbi:MAG TPA: UvrD-helicase domain-containing protein [Candidatus Paceibacterota bacterium]|nr:UvrD-helicase domain-containing protein [Candidatus Paceibacterota bacterium]